MENLLLNQDVLVTGGAGAIGSRLVANLLEHNAANVVVVDDLSSGYEWLLPKDERLRLVKADVCSLVTYEGTLRMPLVFHLAAFFANQNSVDYPLADLHTNGQGTLSTLLYAQRNKASRVVYASAGCSIAGHGHNGPIHEDMPVSLHLDTPYQITKALGEFYCNYFQDQVSTVRCRFFNSYGPGEVPGRYRNVIPNFIWLALHDFPLAITGTGDETRDFVYVDDLVDGLMLAAVRPQANGEAINLGTGVQTKIGDLARLIIDICDSKSAIEYHPPRKWDKSKHREANISKARDRVGYQPRVPIAEGLGRTVQWFQDNYDNIKSIPSAATMLIAEPSHAVAP